MKGRRRAAPAAAAAAAAALCLYKMEAREDVWFGLTMWFRSGSRGEEREVWRR